MHENSMASTRVHYIQYHTFGNVFSIIEYCPDNCLLEFHIA